MSMSEPTRRPATTDDLPGVRALVAAVGREYGFEPEPENVDADLYADAPRYFASEGLLEVLVDERDGAVVGVVGVVDAVPDGDAELRKIYLARDWRGTGLGRRMLERAVEFARSRGARRIVLETSARLREGLALYERAGFVPRPGEHAPRSCACDVRLALEL